MTEGESSSPEAQTAVPMMDRVDVWIQQVREHAVQTVVLPLAAIAASLILTGNYAIVVSWILLPSWNLILRIVGTAIGIGLGLGLAAHVHDRLEIWHARHEATDDDAVPSNLLLTRTRSATSSLRRTSSTVEDETSYAALMTMAGYDVSDNVLRGQIVRKSLPFFRPNYPYTDPPEEQQMGPKIMTEQWPHLPKQITHELGRWIEHIVRDYVACWYSLLDSGCPYQDEKKKRAEREKSAEQENGAAVPTDHVERAMVFHTALHRPIPMMTAMYHSLAIIFGNLSSRAEHVNVFSLVLLKWTKVLGQKLKTYRQLRTLALAKSAPRSTLHASATGLKADMSSPGLEGSAVETHVKEKRSVSEMAMTKEFLLAGKLHRAVCFGLDVPSLLFADASGKECGLEDMTDEQVLQERLFNTKMLYECELDYNRVLGHRLARALLPRAEFSSPIIRTLITELMSGCVLTPIMGCFSPDYVNSWICSGMEAMLASEQKESQESTEDSATTEEVLMRGWDNDDMAGSAVEAPLECAVQDASEVVKEDHESDEESHEAIEVIRNDSGVLEKEENSDHGNDVDRDLDESHENDNVLMSGDHNGSKSLGNDHAVVSNNEEVQGSSQLSGDYILPLLTMAIIDLQRFVDFDEYRQASAGREENATNWDDADCQEAVRQVVLVIEAALVHGRRQTRLRRKVRKDVETDEETELSDSDEFSLLPFSSANLSQVLMELTSDVDAFEARIVAEEKRLENVEYADAQDDEAGEDTLPSLNSLSSAELSTLRTLIAAWLHTGQVYRTVSVLVQARQSILAPYFHDSAFLRDTENAAGLVRQLKSLDGVDIMVDTTSILDIATLEVVVGNSRTTSQKSAHKAKSVTIQAVSPSLVSQSKQNYQDSPLMGSLSLNMARSSGRLQRFISGNLADEAHTEVREIDNSQRSSAAGNSFTSSSPTPRYLDFQRNQSFASSLRAERERRTQSWLDASESMADQGLNIVYRHKGSSEEEKELHKNLHRLARTFYSGTNVIALRDGTRRKEAESGASPSQPDPTRSTGGDDTHEVSRLSLLTVEMGGTRRRIEIPDDDSSFLIRAQPRPLKAEGLHLDQRNHGQSYRTFSATYEEPAILPGSHQYTGGRYIRSCKLKYYPNDHTATIELPAESKHLDQRRVNRGPPKTISIGQPRDNSLSGDFLRKRHLCQKWLPRGAAPRSGGSILANPAMEPADFHSVPRTGKSVDFVYRMSLFECPMVELSGKRFTVHDASATGTHRADASSMELSDASLSAALMTAGGDWENAVMGRTEEGQSTSSGEKSEQTPAPGVEMGSDGYPIVWIKLHQKQGDQIVTEIKPYRASYVRAALWVASTRHEAQRACLLMCVRAGSARNATRSRVDSLLIPTQRLLEFANSPEREKQTILMRDLKLGINHIDREQLRRNKLLYPRHPTSIRSLSAGIEGLLHVRDTGMDFVGASPSTVVYKIRCVAIVELIDTDEDDNDLLEYDSPDGSKANVFREEWVVYRQFRDFNTLHKHLKSQVAATETSGTAGSRLVGAATAAFAVGGAPTGAERRRKILIPSLGQASKAGALGITKKAVEKRRAILNTYLQHLLSPSHPMKQCTEILTFLGAFHAFPSDIRTGENASTVPDSLGRLYMTRTVYKNSASISSIPKGSYRTDEDPEEATARGDSETLKTAPSSLSQSNLSADEETSGATVKAARVKEIEMDPAIRAKIDQVPLGKVRAAIFELIRSHFDFENASFFRNRLLSGLKTVSFAIASNGEFRKTLYNAHKTNLNPDALAGLIKYGLDMLWPDGVLYESAPALTPEESKELSQKAKALLETAFPDQVRSILGAEIVQDGVDMLHEMLQNRLVCKSLFHMFLELLLLEIFPELQDVLTCGSVLEA